MVIGWSGAIWLEKPLRTDTLAGVAEPITSGPGITSTLALRTTLPALKVVMPVYELATLLRDVRLPVPFFVTVVLPLMTALVFVPLLTKKFTAATLLMVPSTPLLSETSFRFSAARLLRSNAVVLLST